MRMIPLVFPFVKGHEKTHMACCEKYKAYILKYKALILKYMPYIFRFFRCLEYNDLQKREKQPFSSCFCR